MNKFLVTLLMYVMVTPLFANAALEELSMLLQQKERSVHAEKIDKKRIQELRQHYYFILIYRSTCPHCHQFAPVLKDFSSYFKIPVRAYSLDGESLEGFDSEPLTPELFQTLYVSGGYKPVVPALYLINRPTNQAFPVLFGEAQPVQLAQRLEQLLTHIEEKFHD